MSAETPPAGEGAGTPDRDSRVPPGADLPESSGVAVPENPVKHKKSRSKTKLKIKTLEKRLKVLDRHIKK